MKWVLGSDKKWDCEHVNKCDILLDHNDELIQYNTDWPEPKLPYRYVFLIDLYPELTKRSYKACGCLK